jgi:hypothetical protein
VYDGGDGQPHVTDCAAPDCRRSSDRGDAGERLRRTTDSGCSRDVAGIDRNHLGRLIARFRNDRESSSRCWSRAASAATRWRKGQTITLHSGQGIDTATDLYWDVAGSAIWNNDGDTVKVLDPQRHIVESFAY